MNEAEIAAQKADRRIVKFTNIDNERFTHSYNGISIRTDAGKSYIGRFPELDHLATHLARKIITREKKRKGISGERVSLWKQSEIDALKLKIISDVGNEDTPEILTPQDERTADLKKIQGDFIPEAPPEVTKKQVINDLKKRGVKVNITQTKEQLLEELMALEAKG